MTKVEEATSCDLSAVNSELIPEVRRLVITTALAQLRTKKDLISQLDRDISETIRDEGELEAELNDADSYLSELEEKIAVVAEFVRKASQPPVMPR